MHFSFHFVAVNKMSAQQSSVNIVQQLVQTLLPLARLSALNSLVIRLAVTPAVAPASS